MSLNHTDHSGEVQAYREQQLSSANDQNPFQFASGGTPPTIKRKPRRNPIQFASTQSGSAHIPRIPLLGTNPVIAAPDYRTLSEAAHGNNLVSQSLMTAANPQTFTYSSKVAGGPTVATKRAPKPIFETLFHCKNNVFGWLNFEDLLESKN